MSEETTAIDVLGCIFAGVFLGIVITLSLMTIMGGSLTGKNTLTQKCAETQGRYDFCVQKIDWEAR